MKHIYLIPGLGADKRLFVNLDLAAYSVHHIEWIPAVESETIEAYAARLSGQIKTSNPIIIGVSFGGIMAVEIGKQIATEKVILISSARTSSEIPFYFKFAGRLGMSDMVASLSFKGVNAMTSWFFGVNAAEEKKLLADIIDETDSSFLKWAMNKIVNWKNRVLLKNLVLIQGTKDRLFPFNTPDFKISGGGHFMIYNRAAAISVILKQIV